MRQALSVCFSLLILLSLVFSLSGCSSGGSVCPNCGEHSVHVFECPVCYNKVCEYCCYEDSYLYKFYSSGGMREYLEHNDYVVLDRQEAYELYAYGFASGYTKGLNNIQDEEVDNLVDGFDYDWLERQYAEYGW